MTSKEKAKNLVIECREYSHDIGLNDNSFSKQLAIMTVKEIIKETKLHDITIYQHGRTAYWQEVKQEIEKL